MRSLIFSSSYSCSTGVIFWNYLESFQKLWDPLTGELSRYSKFDFKGTSSLMKLTHTSFFQELILTLHNLKHGIMWVTTLNFSLWDFRRSLLQDK